MTATITHTLDRDALRFTFTADFDAPADRVWQVWEDPRQLERWWGPPTWPATFDRHDFVPGGESRYHMTGPAGEKAPGWWVTTAIEPHSRIEIRDGFSDQSGEPDLSMPETRMSVTLDEEDGRTRMTLVSHFDSIEELDKVLAMGMVEGMSEAMGQIEGILASTLKR